MKWSDGTQFVVEDVIYTIDRIKEITNDLGLIADGLAKSQIFFSYSDREILATTDMEPLTTKHYLDAISVIDLIINPNANISQFPVYVI